MPHNENQEPIEDNIPEENSAETTGQYLADALAEEKKSNKKGIFIGLLLLLVIPVFAYKFLYKPSDHTMTETVFSLEQARNQADSLYNQLKKELAIYKQENEELYAQISLKEYELENQYSKIKRLIDQAGRDQSVKKEIQPKLNNLSIEIGNLREYVGSQTLDLDELRSENRRLKREKEMLDQKYLEELAEKERLTIEGENLQGTNKELNKKIKTASVLMTSNLKAKGLRLKNNGDRKGVNTAKRTELIELCFSIVRNEVCETGPNRFFLRMLDPSGAVVYDRKRGSGSFRLFANTEEIHYTTSRIFDYDPSVSDLCMEWYAFPYTPFSAGTYRLELYNKGRLVGNQEFSMK